MLAESLKHLREVAKHENIWERNVQEMVENGREDNDLSLRHARRELARYRADRYMHMRRCGNIPYWSFSFRSFSVQERRLAPWMLDCACR